MCSNKYNLINVISIETHHKLCNNNAALIQINRLLRDANEHSVTREKIHKTFFITNKYISLSTFTFINVNDSNLLNETFRIIRAREEISFGASDRPCCHGESASAVIKRCITASDKYADVRRRIRFYYSFRFAGCTRLGGVPVARLNGSACLALQPSAGPLSRLS